MMEIQISLEAARVNIGYSQIEASEKFGVHHQTLAKWEKDNSKMGYNYIEKIPEIYSIPTDNIFFGNRNEFIRYLKKNEFNNEK